MSSPNTNKGQVVTADALEVHTDGHAHAHISSLKLYVGIFLMLIMFTLLTVGVSNIHLGKWNLVVAVVIATMKASLVLLFFMHLKYDNKFNGMIVVLSVMFIGVFFAYTLNDTEHRGEVDSEQGVKILPMTGSAAPGGPPVPAPTATVHVAGGELAPAMTTGAAPAGSAIAPGITPPMPSGSAAAPSGSAKVEGAVASPSAERDAGAASPAPSAK